MPPFFFGCVFVGPLQRETAESFADESVQFGELFKEKAHLPQGNEVRTIALRLLGAGVRLQKERVNTGSHGAPGKREDKTPVAAARAARGAGHLDAVRGVEDDRTTKRAHEGQGAHIHHKLSVPHEGAAFAEHHLTIAGIEWIWGWPAWLTPDRMRVKP